MLVDMISKAFLKCYVAFFNVLYWKIDELYTALNVDKAKENNQNRLQKHFDSSKRLAQSDLICLQISNALRTYFFVQKFL